MHHGMQTPPQMQQQQTHFIVDPHRTRPEDAAIHITVSLANINETLAYRHAYYRLSSVDFDYVHQSVFTNLG